MNTILGELGKSNKFIELLKQIENKKSPVAISGLTDVGLVQMASAINAFGKIPICIITYNEIQAKKIYEDIKYFTDKVALFLKKEIVTYDYIAESKDLPYERIETLNTIFTKKNMIIVTTIEALMQKLPKKESLYKNTIEFKIGKNYNLEEIKQKLIKLGYSRYDLIEGRGQFSIRGGILDISINQNTGIRIEFWGDEVDSIRNFSITSQRSINTLEKVSIYPAHEYILEKSIEDTCKKIQDEYKNTKHSEIIEEDIEQIKAGNYISKIDKYFDCFYEEQETLMEYISNNSCIFLDEIGKIEVRSRNIELDKNNLEKALIEKEKIIPEAITNTLKFDGIEEKLEKRQIVYIDKQDIKNKIAEENYSFQYREINYYKSEIESLINELKKAIKDKKKIYILVSTVEKAKKLQNILNKNEIINKIEEKLNQTIIVKSNESIVTITVGKISSGFECYDLKELVIYADELIDGERKKKRITSTAFKEGEKVVFADLKVRRLCST